MIDLILLDGPGVGIAQVAIATAATMLAIGVAFLMAPSRSTLWWSLTFTLVMVASYGMVAGSADGFEPVRGISVGLMMGAPALLWSGFRALRGARNLAWIGPVVSVLSMGALALSSGTDWYASLSRFVFLAASVFGLLLFVEWRRMPRRQDPLQWPLAIVSLAFPVVGVLGVAGAIGVVNRLWLPITDGVDPAVVRLVGSIGIVVYVVCAIVAVLDISTRERIRRSRSANGSEAGWQHFERAAAEQLARAQRAGQASSVVWLELDDVTEIRQTVGSTALSQLTERFQAAVRDVFPAEAEVGAPNADRAVVVVPRPDAAIRELIRTVLLEISQLDLDGRIAVQPSASAGWAPTSTSGYDLGSLLYFSREAAALARENGGDRWERVGPAVVERLLSGPGRP